MLQKIFGQINYSFLQFCSLSTTNTIYSLIFYFIWCWSLLDNSYKRMFFWNVVIDIFRYCFQTLILFCRHCLISLSTFSDIIFYFDSKPIFSTSNHILSALNATLRLQFERIWMWYRWREQWSSIDGRLRGCSTSSDPFSGANNRSGISGGNRKSDRAYIRTCSVSFRLNEFQ